jgi:hypothetical protein
MTYLLIWIGVGIFFNIVALIIDYNNGSDINVLLLYKSLVTIIAWPITVHYIIKLYGNKTIFKKKS